MKVISIVAAGMFVAALVGCATTETQPSASVTSLAPSAQHWFRISWTAEPGRNGERRLSGYVERAARRRGGPISRLQPLQARAHASVDGGTARARCVRTRLRRARLWIDLGPAHGGSWRGDPVGRSHPGAARGDGSLSLAPEGRRDRSAGLRHHRRSTLPGTLRRGAGPGRPPARTARRTYLRA